MKPQIIDRDFFFAGARGIQDEVFWKSGYSDPATLDSAKAEAVARCLVYLMQIPEEKIGPTQMSRWFERLREFDFKRFQLEFSLLAVERASRAGRKKEAEDYENSASNLRETLGSGLSGPLRENFRRAFQN